VRLRIEVIEARLRAAFVAGHGSVSTRELVLVELKGRDGQLGHGEAAPLPSYDGVRVQDVCAALEDCRSVLAAGDGAPHAELLAACSELAVLPQATAAIDLALWDLAGRRADQPVWRLLGAPPPPPIAVNWTIASADRAGAAGEAAAARAAGFRAVKAKVAIGDDAGRLAAVRAIAGPEMAIRIDANGAWSEQEALAALRVLAPVGIELCEEPVSGLRAIRECAAHTEIPVALDESAADPGSLRSRACELICLKIARCGGISGLIDVARRARRVGYEVYLASTLDGPLGIAAALHAATVVRPQRPSGLSTLGMFDGPEDPLPAPRGRIAIPGGAGLGDGLLAWYAAFRRSA
jgi:L-alanine-DL-glutamate epimerase-like enolase superfamily enzyme